MEIRNAGIDLNMGKNESDWLEESVKGLFDVNQI